VPESAFPRPSSTPNQYSSRSHIRFDITPSPFSFAVVRRSNGETLFDTTDHPLVFENQYLRVKTSLPEKANIYGLGEHSETLRLDERNTTRTMWARDAFGIPKDSNLYGVHPVYIEHRTTGSHGVFLLNSNGMDIKLRADKATGTSLEYNVIGGVLDFYFFAGPSPADVSRQYAQVAGLPAMTPYWNLGVSGGISLPLSMHIPVSSSSVYVCVVIMLTKRCNVRTCSSINGMLVLVFCFFFKPPTSPIPPDIPRAGGQCLRWRLI
jgi:alpha-glucosidase